MQRRVITCPQPSSADDQTCENHSHTPSSRFEADFIEMRPGALFLVALRRSYPNPVSGCDNRRNAQRQQFALL